MIHKYKMNGFRIVLDTNSGAVHIFDEIPFAMLDYLDGTVPDNPPVNMIRELSERYGEEAVSEAYRELRELQESGMLFSLDEYEKFAHLLENAPIKSMCLNVAHDCNLRCEYCFAAKGDFGQGRMLMPFAVAQKAIDFLIANSGKRYHLEVDFFGGEPLMNFDVVRRTVEYARSLEEKYNKNFRFTITTNGLLLTDDKIDYINREMSNVVLSIDGRKEVHDRLRIRAGGGGSYDTVVPKFQRLVNGRGEKDYYARGTFTRYNMDFTEDALHLADLGFKQISIEPVVSDEALEYSIKQEDLPRVFEEYEHLARTIIKCKKDGKEFHFFHFMLDLNQGPCAIKRLRGCSCGNEYIAVTPEGDIYPCHQFVGEKSWQMGSVMDGYLDQKLKHDFATTNIYAKNECKKCWAKFYCSGGCNANSWQYEGSIHSPHQIACALEKKRIECAIMIQAAMTEMV